MFGGSVKIFYINLNFCEPSSLGDGRFQTYPSWEVCTWSGRDAERILTNLERLMTIFDTVEKIEILFNSPSKAFCKRSERLLNETCVKDHWTVVENNRSKLSKQTEEKQPQAGNDKPNDH